MSETSVADAMVDVLVRAGTQRVFGQPGTHNLALWSALGDSPIRVVGVRHEQTAVYAADGEARVSGRVGVAVTTSGPGAANALTATGEAWASGSPVLVISTDIPHTLRRAGCYRGVLHENRDQAAMFAPVTKATLRAETAEQVPQLTALGLRLAAEAPSRPVYLEIPTDLLASTLEQPGSGGDGTDDQAGADLSGQGSDDAACERIAEALVSARCPLIWAGGGCVRSGCGPTVARLAELLAAPVIETYQGRGLLPREHPGKVTVSPHIPQIGALWDEADAVLAVGTDFDGMMTQNWRLPQPRWLGVINIDQDDASKAYPPDEVIVGDAGVVLEKLMSALTGMIAEPRSDGSAVRDEIQGRERSARSAAAVESKAAATFLDTIAALGPDVVVVTDMCIPGYWLAAYGGSGAPRRFLYPVGWGTLGFGFPAAIGAALASTLPVLAVVGDGGFMFACGELSMLAQEQVPLTVLIVDDGGYGMIRFDQQQLGMARFGVDLHHTDLVTVAHGFGVSACSVQGVDEELAHALKSGLASGSPNVVVAHAALPPPLSTSPRWYRRAA